MNELEIILEATGGLAILLYGVNLLSSNLQKVLGLQLENVLKKTDRNPIKGLAIGAGITGIIQSSGTTTTMLIGFISAGLISLESAAPVMLGANIGGTVTTQLAAFQIGLYALFILTAGFLVYVFSARRIYKNIGEALLGAGFLFLGMNFIFNGAYSLASHNGFSNFINAASSNIFLAITAAAFFTFIIQSGSAASVLVIALGVAHIISLQSALFLILGVNLGASLKVVYLALRGIGFSSKLALIHLFFNFFGIIAFTLFFQYFSYLVSVTSNDIGRQIANAHTLYNVINAFVLLPVIPLVVKIIDRCIPSKRIKKLKMFYLEKRLLYTPSAALNQVNGAVVDMAKTASEMLENSRLIFFENKTELIKKVEKQEREIDEMTGKISEYTIQVSQQNLNKRDSMKLYSLMHILTDLEHLSDHIMTISQMLVDFKKQKLAFSEKAVYELTAVYGKLKIMRNLVVKSLKEDNEKLAYEIIKHENKVDEIVKKAYSNHLERINKGICSLESGEYFSEILSNLERIGDHYDNIAYAVVDRFKYK